MEAIGCFLSGRAASAGLPQQTWTRGELNDSDSSDGGDGIPDADSVDSLTRDYMANCDSDVDLKAQAAFASPSRQQHVDELFAASDALALGAPKAAHHAHVHVCAHCPT